MPDQTAEQTEAQATPEELVVRRSSSVILVRITVLLFLVAVVGTECLIASLWLPTSSPATSIDAERPGKEAKAKDDGSETPSPADEPSDGEKKPPEQVEVDLEQFNVAAHQPVSNTTIRINFHLFGVISPNDKGEFEKLFKANHHRFREQVLVTLRSAEGSDLADAGLGLIKRQILEKTNALLGKPLLRGVIVSDFSYMEQ